MADFELDLATRHYCKTGERSLECTVLTMTGNGSRPIALTSFSMLPKEVEEYRRLGDLVTRAIGEIGQNPASSPSGKLVGLWLNQLCMNPRHNVKNEQNPRNVRQLERVLAVLIPQELTDTPFAVKGTHDTRTISYIGVANMVSSRGSKLVDWLTQRNVGIQYLSPPLTQQEKEELQENKERAHIDEVFLLGKVGMHFLYGAVPLLGRARVRPVGVSVVELGDIGHEPLNIYPEQTNPFRF